MMLLHCRALCRDLCISKVASHRSSLQHSATQPDWVRVELAACMPDTPEVPLMSCPQDWDLRVKCCEKILPIFTKMEKLCANDLVLYYFELICFSLLAKICSIGTCYRKLTLLSAIHWEKKYLLV